MSTIAWQIIGGTAGLAIAFAGIEIWHRARRRRNR